MIGGSFSRTDRSQLSTWWWTIDRWLFFALSLLMLTGFFLSFSASPSVAHKLNLDSFFFVKRHIIFLIPAFGLLVGTSLISPQFIRFGCWLLFLGIIVALIMTPFLGLETKGAKRWLNIFGFSLQASEFIKPVFAVIAAWLFAQKQADTHPTPVDLSIGLYLFVVGLIILQPDFGMVFVISGVWFLQFFLAGLSLFWVYLMAGLGIIGVGVAYFALPHVASRIDRFLNPQSGDQYQITQSLESFRQGGLFGKGPGEGTIKRLLPDSHADFVFSVAGEEFGFLFCVFVLLLFSFIVVRIFWLARKENNFFLRLAISGITVQFALQALVNMGSSLHLIPTKGMTLPFLSYGGSSLLATALGMGMVLSFTRRRLDDKNL